MIREFHKVMEYRRYFPNSKYFKEGVLHHSKELNVIEYLCPCGCKQKVFINSKGYMSTATCWDITLKDGKVTVSPSIRMTSGCESHYFIKENKVQWCADSPILQKGRN